MQRKLIQLSPSTSVVSLPASWIKKNNLEKGTALEVHEQENSITITPVNVKIQEKEITLDIRKLEERLMWITIDAAYTAGYDSIIILTKDSKQTRHMTTVVRYFPGMIIHEERKNKVHFKDIASASRGDVNKILNRIFNLTIALLEEGGEALDKKDWKSLVDIKVLDYNINAYVSYCLRQINKFGYVPISKTGTMHSYIKVLEIMADRICDMFIGMGQDEHDCTKEKPILQQIISLYRLAHRMHFKFTQERLIELEKKRQELLSSLTNVDDHVRLYLTDILELFFDLEQVEMQLHT